MEHSWTPTSSVNGVQSSTVGVLTPATSVAGDQSSIANMWTPTTSVSGVQSSHTNMWTPSTSVAGDQSSMRDIPAEHGFASPLGQAHESTQPANSNAYSSRDMPFRPSPSALPAPNNFPPTDLLPAVKARIIRGDVYYMPITLTFNNEISNSSININLPGRPTATYPEPLMTGT